jgi:hypothetical protein
MWEKLQQEIDRAGEAAKDVLDEGKLRIELFRVRQVADRAAEALGYAIHRAKRDGRTLDPETGSRLEDELSRHDAEATRIEAELERLRKKDMDVEPEATAAGASGSAASGSTAADGSTATGA